MDAGPILLQEEVPIAENETATDLAARLAEAGAVALVEALALLTVGQLVERAQDDALATFAPKVDRAAARVDWNRPARDVANLIRAMDDAPGAWSTLHEEPVKLFRPELEVVAATQALPGEVLQADPKGGLIIATASGALRVHEVQPQGKRRMAAQDWIRGRGVERGARFA
jgi:methionyl-tRNA formyltransferase